MSAPWLEGLNDAQRLAATHPGGPLLIVAGAGTGKTRTLAARVAHLIASGVPPERILLLTFTRRAAAEMLARASAAVGGADPAETVWGGTFHSIAHRLLRIYAPAAGLSPDFMVLDPSDSADLLDVLRQRLGLGGGAGRFPRKTLCWAIYSRCVNADSPLTDVLAADHPWCADRADDLRRLFAAYVAEKQRRHLLDFDDLLLYWLELARSEEIGPRLDERFEHILVDEFQDTNAIQFALLEAMRRRHRNLTVVGDDAQSIYRFRGAVPDQMLRFPQRFPDAAVLHLDLNYRSVQPILDTANRLLRERPAAAGYPRELRAVRRGGTRPRLVPCRSEGFEARFVAEAVLRHAEEGIPLHRIAVLMRAADHSADLEIELARRQIPFRKYGGLRFLEIAHVKDVLAILRIAQNPGAEIAAFRTFQLLAGVGPATAAAIWASWAAAGHLPDALRAAQVPPASRAELNALADLLEALWRSPPTPAAAVAAAREFYRPICERIHDRADARMRDLENLERIAAGYHRLADFLADLALDPPAAAGDEAGSPVKNDDWLVLSTIHSAKGGEWDVVFLIHAADGCLPSDLAAGSACELEEERRLFYVAVTRARDVLYISWPLQFRVRSPSRDARTVTAPPSRFLTAAVRATMDETPYPPACEPPPECAPLPLVPGLQERLRQRWSRLAT
ncbi:MAG: ATP-dependent helicase [Kiritimatiellae bacterium]|nr:ATP-dependent helicase [Kiritimatiellia bacterium]